MRKRIFLKKIIKNIHPRKVTKKYQNHFWDIMKAKFLIPNDPVIKGREMAKVVAEFINLIKLKQNQKSFGQILKDAGIVHDLTPEQLKEKELNVMRESIVKKLMEG